MKQNNGTQAEQRKCKPVAFAKQCKSPELNYLFELFKSIELFKLLEFLKLFELLELLKLFELQQSPPIATTFIIDFWL